MSPRSASTPAARPVAIQLVACFTVFVDMMGVGLILPVTPQLLERITGASTTQAAMIGGWLLFAYAAAQVVCAPLVGRLSDRLGRRPVLLASILGLTVNYLAMATTNHLFVLFLSRVLSGIFGATFPIAASIVADVSTPAERARRFGFLEASAGMGLIFGPALGGLLGSLSPAAPFIAAGVLSAMNLAIAGAWLPVVRLAAEPAQNETGRSGFAILRSSSLVVCGALAFFLVDLATQALPTIWAFFASTRYGWSPAIIGATVFTYGLSMAISQTLLVELLKQRLGVRATVTLGFLLGAGAYLGLAIFTGPLEIYFCIVAGAVATVVFPVLRAELSSSAPPGRQGELQGALSSVASAAILCGSLLMTQIFGVFGARSGMGLGAPFFLASALFTSAGLLMAIYYGSLTVRAKTASDQKTAL